ncbi:bifunctional ADP-dependent NAD(P)H-hydrate dehydratase/NAD(P)H-hydrate epimerase, partial [Rubrivivax gelatinosus]|nr:bifunctional ADP-dependent NAD(P)H-hydrate dehydratase/NAD(P)H-hydrate epimerase [Rubrivivax gelatinosus]
MSPVPVTPERGWQLHTSAASRAAEAATLAVTPPHALMQRAGLGVARLALALAPHARTIAVLAGPGNNGGDGLVAARHLHAAGKALRVVLLGDEQRLPADAADALQAARAAGVPITDRLDEAPADLVVDALLGLGTTRAPEG